MPPKTSCPVSLTQFMEKAEPLKVTINGQDMLAEVKQFSTGSFGWYMNGKTVVTVDGKAISVQIGMNMTVVGRKDADMGEPFQKERKSIEERLLDGHGAGGVLTDDGLEAVGDDPEAFGQRGVGRSSDHAVAEVHEPTAAPGDQAVSAAMGAGVDPEDGLRVVHGARAGR